MISFVRAGTLKNQGNLLCLNLNLISWGSGHWEGRNPLEEEPVLVLTLILLCKLVLNLPTPTFIY